MRIENFVWFLATSADHEDQRQFCVLYWKARGLTHKEIAQSFGYAEVWVQRYMTRTYAQLGMTDWKQADKEAWLERELYPVIRKLMDDHPEIMKLLPPPPAGSPPPTPPLPPLVVRQRENSGNPRNIFLFGAFLVLLAFFYWLGQQHPASPKSPAVTQITTQPLPSPLPSPIPSPAPPLAPTVTPAPTATDTAVPTTEPSATLAPLVVPEDGILFADDFNGGISPEWQTAGSEWLLSDGALTLSTNQSFNNQYNWIRLDHPEWRNYTLSLDVQLYHGQRAPMGDVAIAVRTAEDTSVGVEISNLYQIYWANLGTDFNDTGVNAGENSDYSFPGGFTNVELTVNGYDYTLRVEGQKIQTVSILSARTGGIALGVECDYYAECPAFDNVKVTYLP